MGRWLLFTLLLGRIWRVGGGRARAADCCRAKGLSPVSTVEEREAPPMLPRRAPVAEHGYAMAQAGYHAQFPYKTACSHVMTGRAARLLAAAPLKAVFLCLIVYAVPSLIPSCNPPYDNQTGGKILRQRKTAARLGPRARRLSGGDI